MHLPANRLATIASAIAAPVGVVTAAALIWSSSNAAFSASTRNSGNAWATGTVAISDDDAGSARFQVTNMLPGQTDTRCIAVTANATVPGVVRSYAVNPINVPGSLSDRIFFSLRTGPGGSFASCTGFVADRVEIPASAPLSLSVLAQSSDYASAVSAADWTVPAGTSSRTFEITWKFDTTGLTQTQLNALQGTQSGIDFQWELQNS